MAISTFFIGILPTYVSIGIMSTIILIALRIVQGIAVSGEMPGALTLLYEENRTKITVSMSMAATFFGMLLASLTIVSLNETLGELAVKEWGWRIPFVIALALGLLSILIRKNMSESRIFSKTITNGHLEKTPIKTLIKNHKHLILSMILIFQLSVILSYTTFVYFPNIRASSFPQEYSEIHIINSVNLFIMTLLIPLIANFTPMKKTIPTMFLCSIFCILTIPAIFYGLLLDKTIYFALSQFTITILGAFFVAGFPFLLSKSFPTNIRYSGNAIVLNITSGFFAGSTPFLLNFIAKSTGSIIYSSIYIGLSAILAIIGLLTLLHIYNIQEKAFEIG